MKAAPRWEGVVGQTWQGNFGRQLLKYPLNPEHSLQRYQCPFPEKKLQPSLLKSGYTSTELLFRALSSLLRLVPPDPCVLWITQHGGFGQKRPRNILLPQLLAVRRSQRGISRKLQKRGVKSGAGPGGGSQRSYWWHLLPSSQSKAFLQPGVSGERAAHPGFHGEFQTRLRGSPRPWEVMAQRAFPSAWIFIAPGAAPGVRRQRTGSAWGAAERQKLLKLSKEPNIQAFFLSPPPD